MDYSAVGQTTNLQPAWSVSPPPMEGTILPYFACEEDLGYLAARVRRKIMCECWKLYGLREQHGGYALVAYGQRSWGCNSPLSGLGQESYRMKA